MAQAVLLAVSKIGAVVSNEEVAAVIEKLPGRGSRLKELPIKIRRIDKELKMMNNTILDWDTTHRINDVFKGCIANVTNLAYHVEDVIDKYSYETLKLKEEGILNQHAFKVSGHHIKVFGKILDEVLEIEEEIRNVKGLHNDWSNTDQFIKNEFPRDCFPELVSDEDLVGIDENRSKLTEWLSSDEKESTVISVCGMGGLGKTALVKNVYDREKANFPDGHAWIVMSETYDVIDSLVKLLDQIRHTQQSPPAVGVVVDDQADAYDITNEIKNILQERKCLIVLDDMWDRGAYTQMCSAFEGLQGSRVIITTRKEDVAALAHLRRRLQLQPLCIADSFKLFYAIAFNNNRLGRKCSPELEMVAAAVVERCHGLPLTIAYSGSLFSMKQPTEDAWNHMYNNLRIKLLENSHVQAIFNLSYNDLPGDLRNCLLHCTFFSQGHPMTRESLARLWLAEGFVMKKDNNSTLEEVAEENLAELIGRNMLQVVERDECLRVSTCKMHDIVRDLAIAVAKEERFGSTNDQGEMILMDREVRRFSTCDWSDRSKTAPAGVKFPLLRTFVSVGSSSNMLSLVFSGSKYLTVLELQDSPITQVPASIGNMLNLRYIGLRHTQVQSLPDTIDKLLNLETLDLKKTRIEKLPPGIVKAEKLRHLFADRFADENQKEFRYFVGVEAPKMISSFQELQDLETVHASKDLVLELKKMFRLQTVSIDNIDASICEDLFFTLSKIPRLSSLVLSASHEMETLSFQYLKPISNRLHRLIVRGGWGIQTFNCPIFQVHGKNLKYLALSWGNFGTEDPLKLLAAYVPDLTYLSLNRVSSKGISVLSDGCFPQLKTLVLKRMSDVTKLVFKDGSMPSIDEICITTLLGLNAVPHGIDTLGSLRKLWMLDLHREFKADWIHNQMDYKMKHVTDLRV